MCPNILQMSVVSIETHESTLWKYLLDTLKPGQPGFAAEVFQGSTGQILPKLRSLTLQTDMSQNYWGDLLADFSDVFSQLLARSPITELRACGVGVINPRSSIAPVGANFETLQRIELTHCRLGLDRVDALLSSCNNLRSFMCHWHYLSCEMFHQEIDLLPSLGRHSKSLEDLCLTMNLGAFDISRGAWVSSPNLCGMEALNEAELSNLFIPDRTLRKYTYGSGQPISIASGLPPSLEHLILSYNLDSGNAWDDFPILDLQRLADDCPRYLPRLWDMTIDHGNRRITGPLVQVVEDLIRHFKENGVQLRMEKYSES